MAKKDIASLVSGIMGTNKPDCEIGNSKHQSTHSTAVKNKNDDGDEIMTTSFRSPKKLMRKLRMISGAEGVGVGTIIQEAFEKYIENWESDHGTLNI